MNHDYTSLKETLIERGIDVHENYLKEALKSYGFEEFPQSGLNDRGLDKIVKRAIDISHNEEQLIKPEYKKGKLLIQKEKPSKKSGSLESQIVKEDLKKGMENIKMIGKYSLELSLGNLFACPTITRNIKERSLAYGLVPIFFVEESLIFHTLLWRSGSKLALPITLFQIGTNLASLAYEYVRHVKKKAKEKEQRIPRFDRDPAGHLEGIYD